MLYLEKLNKNGTFGLYLHATKSGFYHVEAHIKKLWSSSDKTDIFPS